MKTEPQGSAQGTSVSIDAETVASCVDQTSALLGMRLGSEQRPGVIVAFTAYAVSAKLLMEFELPTQLEPASVYSFVDETDDR